jgi:hypothetical protein
MKIELTTASLDNVEEVLTLHSRYQINTIAEEDKEDGFITTAFTKTHLARIIEEENGLFIARIDNKIVAYAMAASWQFWSQWPMFTYMIKQLPDAPYLDREITIANSYQYGPVCVDKQVRGTGVFEQLFNFSLQEMSKRYPIMVTFINKLNPRSFAAHTGKTNLQVLNEFEFNNNQYFKLACATT